MGRVTWTEEADRQLIALRVKGLSFERIGHVMNKSKNSCLARYTRMGRPQTFEEAFREEPFSAENSFNHYDDDDDALLQSGVSLKVAAEMLGRSLESVTHRKRLLDSGHFKKGNIRPDAWSDYELGVLEYMSDEGHGPTEIAEVLGRNVNSVAVKKSKLKKTNPRSNNVISSGLDYGLSIVTKTKGRRLNGMGRDLNIKDPDKYWAEKMRRRA